METEELNEVEAHKNGGISSLSTLAIVSDQQKKLSIPAVVVRNENNDIIEQMDEANVDISQTIRRNLKSKLIQRANSPVKEQTGKVQEALSENSESGSEEGLSDSSDTEKETATEPRKADGESAGQITEESQIVVTVTKSKEIESATGTEQGKEGETSVPPVKENKELEFSTAVEQEKKDGKSTCPVKESKEMESVTDVKQGQEGGKNVCQFSESITIKDPGLEGGKSADTIKEGEQKVGTVKFPPSAVKEDEKIVSALGDKEVKTAKEQVACGDSPGQENKELNSATSTEQEKVEGEERKVETAPALGKNNKISSNKDFITETEAKVVPENITTDTNEESDKKIPSEDVATRGGETTMEQTLSKEDIQKKTTVEIVAEEEKDQAVNKNLTENDNSCSNKKSVELNGKSSDQHDVTEIASKEGGSEAKKDTNTDKTAEEEADNEKDFSQFNLTKATPASSTGTPSLPPPPLMIPALGLAVNPATLPAVGQFPRGAVDLNTVAMQQFQQFNVQPSAENSPPPLTRVIYTPAVASPYPAGVGRFPAPGQAINVIQGSQVTQGSPSIITGLPVGIVPFMQTSNVGPMVHQQNPAIVHRMPPVLAISSTAAPASGHAIQRVFQSPTGSPGVGPPTLSNQASPVSIVPLSSASPLIQPGITVNRSVAAAPQVVTTTTPPPLILATQTQVRPSDASAITTINQRSPTIIPLQTQPKPSTASLQQTADASTYVDNDTMDVAHVNKVKMFYFQCDKCTFVTKSAQNFRRHCMLHLNYKPYACSNCGFSSCNKYGFSGHLKNHQECVGQKFVYKKDYEVERQLERNVNACKCHKWVSDEENDKSSKELFGDQRRFRFTAKKSEPGNTVLQSGISGETTEDSSPDVQLGVVRKTYSGKKKIRDILGEMENNSRKQVEHTNKKISCSDVAERNNDKSVSEIGENPLSEKIGCKEEDNDTEETSETMESLPTVENNDSTSESEDQKYKKRPRRLRQKKQNGTRKTSSYLKKNFQKAKKLIMLNKKKLKRRRNQASKVQNFEIVDESNILDLPRVRKFKTTFDPSPDLYKRRKREYFEEEEFQRPSKMPTPPKPEPKETPLYYKCPYCEHSGDTAVGIKRHAFWVHNMCEYTCNLCMYISMSKQECLKHCYADHPGTSPCIKRSFCKAMEVEEITDNRSSQKEDKSDDKVDEKENDEREGSDLGSVGKESLEESRPQTKYPMKGPPSVRCVQCDMQFTRKGMQFHLLRMHQLFMYKCSHCKFVSHTIEPVTNHCSSNHDSKVCKPMRITYDLDLGHDLIEFIPKQKSKEIKKSKFSRVLKLKQNLKRKVRPLSMKANCPLCGFASNYIGVQRHLSMRHKLKKLQCGRCGHATYNKADALQHSSKVHKEETPYVLRTFADIETVEAMSKDELKKCGVVIFEQKEGPSFNSEGAEADGDMDAKSKEPTPGASPEKDSSRGEWVSCPVCFAEKRTLRGVELHMMHLHKICNWLCGRCGFQSTDKYVTLQHSVDLHKDEDPMISRTLVNLDKYLTEKNMELGYRSATTNQLVVKSDPYKPDFDDNESVDSYLNLESQKSQEGASRGSSVDHEFSSYRKASKHRSCSPKGSDYGSVVAAASDKLSPKKPTRDSPRDLSRDSPRIPDRESEQSDSSEDGIILKKKRNKKSPVVARASPSIGELVFLLIFTMLLLLNSRTLCAKTA